MNRPDSLGWWWFKGEHHDNRRIGDMKYRLAWWKVETVALRVYDLDEKYGAVNVGDKSVLLRDLRGTWEKAQLPSWENDDVR